MQRALDGLQYRSEKPSSPEFVRRTGCQPVAGGQLNSLFWIRSVHFLDATLIKSDHLKRFCLETGNLHSWRPGRHPWNPNPEHSGAFGEQPVDFFEGNMSFNRIAIHDGCMTRLEFVWNMILGFDRGKVFLFYYIYFKACFFQVTAPVCAASSSRGFVEGDGFAADRRRIWLGLRAARKGTEQADQEGQDQELFHVRSLSVVWFGKKFINKG